MPLIAVPRANDLPEVVVLAHIVSVQAADQTGACAKVTLASGRVIDTGEPVEALKDQINRAMIGAGLRTLGDPIARC
jgi:hypothetical protein